MFSIVLVVLVELNERQIVFSIMISKFYVYRYFFIILVVVVSLPFIAYLIQFNKYVCNPFKLGQIQLI